MKRFLILTFIIAFYLDSLNAQSAITGTIVDTEGAPLSFVNVLLLSGNDSSLVKGSVTHDNGRFEIMNVQQGTFLVRAFMTGLADYYSNLIIIAASGEERDLGMITLEEDNVLMNTVEVVAKKALFEQKIDRMVVNVANSITSTGLNALEVLERSPGIIVNRQSNLISISGKNGVVVMINGRTNYMPADAVVSMLAGMSSANIEKIEIITTPPAGFDAEGNAGYINIILKKNLNNGLAGAFGANIGYGKGEQAGANLNFNYRQGRANLYGDYSYVKEAQEQVFEFYRRIMLEGDVLETDTRSLRDPDTDNHNARLGLDYQLDQKTVLGILLSGYDTKWTMEAVNSSLISRNGSLDTSIIIYNSELNQWKHAGGNINLQHTFSDGKLLTIDADMLWYRDNNPTDYKNEYSDGNGNYLFERLTRSRKITPIEIKVGKIDYVTGLGDKMKIETGLKGTLSHFTNDVGVDHLEGQTWRPEPDLTARYNLDEEIIAAYLSFESPLLKGINLKAGLRYEYTSSNLGSAEQINIVDRKFGAWFPSVFLSKEFNENNTINLSYSRRITRPTFNDMAPFIIFLDPSTFFSGNPALQPGIADNFKFGYKHKTVLISVEYSAEDSTIARFQNTVEKGTNRHLIFAENLVSTNTIGLTLSIPASPVKWWNMYYNMSGNYQRAQKYFEEGLISFETLGLNVFTTQTITLPASFTFELTGFYNSGGLFGILYIKPFGSVNVGLQKKFDRGGGTLRIGYDDIFNTMQIKDESQIPGNDEYFRSYFVFSQPTLKIGYAQPFGDQKVKAMRERKTGSEEERQRIN